ncbi:MAG: branched-chain amino acid ABC transporter permease [Hungatella sp.]|nr:branched-chain amino acid ABC transporter permease [Hungatella sp.]
MHKAKKSTWMVIAVMIAAALAAPVVAGPKNNYMLNILISYCYFGILAASLNLLIGYTGQMSLGHAAFMAIGGYAYAILNKTLGMHFLIAVIGAVVISFICGLFIGLACSKLSTIFLAMTTSGFAKAVTLTITNEKWLTGGANGFTGIPKLTILGHKLGNFELYYVALAITLFVFLFCYRLIYSKTGRAMQAVRNAPIAAAAMGINVNGYKFLVCGISAALAGLAGCIYAVNMNYLSADMFNKTSITLLTMTVCGGMGSLFGPVAGTLVIGTLPELLRAFSGYLDGVYGVLIILVMLFMPEGIYGGIRSLAEKVMSKKKAGAPAKKEA